jgi:adenosylcobyric acid synthase
MARTVLFAGTTRNAGVATLVAALCRRFADRGRSLAPFAPLASAPVGATVAPTVRTQALAARVAPERTLSPVHREPDGSLSLAEADLGVPSDDRDERWGRAREAAERAHATLADRYDLLLAAGTDPLAAGGTDGPPLGSLELVRFADADVVLVADASDGGAFASLVGTLDLLPADVRDRVRACVLTRVPEADAPALARRVDAVEARTLVPVAGLVPPLDSGTVEEAARTVDDGVTLPFTG